VSNLYNWRALLLLIPLLAANAQELPPRIEAGVHLAAVDESELHEKPLGAGGRFTLRLNRLVSLDSEVNRYPAGGAFAIFPMTQVLVGARVGVVLGAVGIFGKIRPGFSAYDVTAYKPGIGTKPNLDIGGVLEFYSRRHVGARMDAGGTVFFYGSGPVRTPAGPDPIVLRTRTLLQASFGVFAWF
jgi:hypothetical protein